MSHIHIPDGVLPIGWWLIGYLVAIGILLIAVRNLEKGDVRKRIPYLGVISALMLITMSIPIGALPFHINLTILTGILAGPWLGYVSIFMVNFFLSFLGHGGITVVGINTLILGSEIFIGWGIFQLARKVIKDLAAAGIATAVALMLSTVLMMGVIGASQLGWEYALPHDHHEHEHSGEEQLVDGDVPADHDHEHEYGQDLEQLANSTSGDGELVDHDHLHTPEEAVTTHQPVDGKLKSTEAQVDPANAEGMTAQSIFTSFLDKLQEVSFFSLSGLWALITIMIIGIGLEVLVTVLMVRFFKKVRPDLLR